MLMLDPSQVISQIVRVILNGSRPAYAIGGDKSRNNNVRNSPGLWRRRQSIEAKALQQRSALRREWVGIGERCEGEAAAQLVHDRGGNDPVVGGRKVPELAIVGEPAKLSIEIGISTRTSAGDV